MSRPARRRPRTAVSVRSTRWIIIPVLVFLTILSITGIVLRREPDKNFVSVVLAGDPVQVLTYSPREQSVVIIEIPKSAVTFGVHGYGVYSLESLWKLGDLDKKDGVVLSQSLEDALGIPVRWYIGVNQADFPRLEQGSAGVRKFFSYGHIYSVLKGSLRTNISLVDYFRLTWKIKRISPEKFTVYSLSRDNALTQEALPDNTTVDRIDRGRADIYLGHAFESEFIRGEKIDIGVYNTTSMPGLAQKVARLLGRIGAVVVTAGNDPQRIPVCEMRASERVLKSETASLIRHVYNCNSVVRDEPSLADLDLYLGSDYEMRFLPTSQWQ